MDDFKEIEETRDLGLIIDALDDIIWDIKVVPDENHSRDWKICGYSAHKAVDEILAKFDVKFKEFK